MPPNCNEPRYRWLRVLLGAVVTVAVALGLILVLVRWLTTWAPPGLVTIPPSPPVHVSLQDHPRLLAAHGAIEALAAQPESPQYRRLMRKADEFYAEYLVDPLQGDTIYPGYFALAWRASGDDRYLTAARDMVLNVCDFPRWQRRPESANFYKIELAYAVGLAYDLLYDQFSEKERFQIEEDLVEVLDGLIWHLQGEPTPPFWHDAPHSNYFVAQHSAAGLLALCLGDAYPRWEEALAYACAGLECSIERFERDGGWIEGLTYQDFCWGQHGVLFLNALRANGGPNRLAEDWYSTGVRFALAGILPSGKEQVNFGDNISDPIASFGYLWRARAFFDSPFLDDFLARHLPDPDYPQVPLDALLLEMILAFDPTLPLDEFHEPPLCQYFPGIEWAFLRESWTDPDSFFFATKAGYGGWDHNHVDQGTFILAFDGEMFIADPGRGDFRDRRAPAVNNLFAGPRGHNVFVPGIGPNACFWDDFTMYSPNEAYRQTDARIVDWVDTLEYTSFTLVLDGAYPSEGLTRWRRHVMWQKHSDDLPGGALLILDDPDVPGGLRLATPLEIGDRQGGIVLKGESSELGLCVFASESEVRYEIEELPGTNPSLHAVVVSADDEEGFMIVASVLLPRDQVDRPTVTRYQDAFTFGAWVNGVALRYRRDEESRPEFIPQD